jgi:hypothetical protein
VVFDYHVCRSLYLRHEHALLIANGQVFRAAWEIWDLTPARLSDYRANPAEEFTLLYNMVMFTAQLDRYGELGREGCQQLLDDYALSWEAYNALLNQRGGVD